LAHKFFDSFFSKYGVILLILLAIFGPAFYMADESLTIVLILILPFVFFLFRMGAYILDNYILERIWKFILTTPDIIAEKTILGIQLYRNAPAKYGDIISGNIIKFISAIPGALYRLLEMLGNFIVYGDFNRSDKNKKR
jgi:hypothetical protein